MWNCVVSILDRDRRLATYESVRDEVYQTLSAKGLMAKPSYFDVRVKESCPDSRIVRIKDGELDAFALSAWFPQVRGFARPLINNEPPTLVYVTKADALESVKEAHMRVPNMENKWHRSEEQRVKVAFEGLCVEQVCKAYFQQRWPTYVEEPENFGLYKQWCDHDFKLWIAGSWRKFDVTTVRQTSPGKPKCEAHIYAQMSDCPPLIVSVFGWSGHEQFVEGVADGQELPFSLLEFRLNLQTQGIPFSRIAQIAGRGTQRAA